MAVLVESRKGHTAAEWMEVWEENAGQSRADVARCLATTKDLAFKAVGKVERERFVYEHVAGLGANESSREWATRWAPSGEVERMIWNLKKVSLGCTWRREGAKPGGGGRRGES